MKLCAILVLGVGLVLGTASRAPATKYPPCVCLPAPLELEIGGGFSPVALPKHELTPIALSIHGKVQNADGSHPPALEEVIVDFDKRSAIEAAGLRACGRAELETRSIEVARHACHESIVGTGTAHVGVELSEQRPLVLGLPLIVFNGGVKNGETTLFVYSSSTSLDPEPIIATVKLRKVDKGRFGLEAVVTIPKIERGDGSILDFSLTIKRRLESNGAERHLAVARCPDAHLNAHLTGVFSDGSRLTGEPVRPCSPI